ncbi:Hypothetical protein NTJ_07262 [Nesidiocoris tenuis]|uniref:Uncharacterized protein n=1 Tax=Nesidiocoris tenuis TaxID=355587 RepID=A0ABN7AQH4_9HEMI|nr:Hypothetical protein NTJ_07262 [Nesidiocoris tenuis]
MLVRQRPRTSRMVFPWPRRHVQYWNDRSASHHRRSMMTVGNEKILPFSPGNRVMNGLLDFGSILSREMRDRAKIRYS